MFKKTMHVISALPPELDDDMLIELEKATIPSDWFQILEKEFNQKYFRKVLITWINIRLNCI
jgi:hypothetical protein